MRISWAKAAIAPKANLNSNRTEIYNRIRAKAENIAITALPLSSEPILGLILPLLRTNSVMLSGTSFGKDWNK